MGNKHLFAGNRTRTRTLDLDTNAVHVVFPVPGGVDPGSSEGASVRAVGRAGRELNIVTAPAISLERSEGDCMAGGTGRDGY